MGDRVSVSFRKKTNLGKRESVALYSHWGGKAFAYAATEYARNLKKRVEGRQINPIDRLEPDIVIVDFIRHITDGMNIVESDLYLAKDGTVGDNSDNGHYIIDLDTLKMECSKDV